MLYGNEKEIGEAIREKIADGTVKREELFVVTKLWNTFHETEKVVPTCKKSLENFGLDYLDLYLIHWPVAQRIKGELNINLPFKDAVGIDYDYVDTWKGMEECVRLGLAKSIGLSNFNSAQVQRVLDNATIKPAMNQVIYPSRTRHKRYVIFFLDRSHSEFESEKADQVLYGSWRPHHGVQSLWVAGKTLGQARRSSLEVGRPQTHHHRREIQQIVVAGHSALSNTTGHHPDSQIFQSETYRTESGRVRF
jgi:hypothetical protein